MITRVLIVCTGNLCRSPMAEGLLSSLLPGSSVTSAGISAITGHPADTSAAAALMQFTGIDIKTHRTRRLNAAMCSDAELILVMEWEQQRIIQKSYPWARGKVYCFDDKEDIVDPRGRCRLAFDECLARIAAESPRWANRIRSTSQDYFANREPADISATQKQNREWTK
jgi:protein-tyrosine phosphatase